jgi:hypothetical protein
MPQQLLIKHVADRIYANLIGGARSGDVPTRLGVELACLRTFIELAASRILAETPDSARDICRLECEVRQAFDAVISTLLPKFAAAFAEVPRGQAH